MYKVIAYIDGFNLYYGLRDSGLRRYYWLNIQDLVRNLLKPNQNLVTTKYFTSRVSSTVKDLGKSRRQNQYLEAIKTLANVQIFYGHYLEKKVQCLRCGSTWATHEEKMTDVHIATEIMTDAFQGTFDIALIISADSDLTGPIEATKKLFPEKRVVIAFPPKRNSKRLKQACHAHFVIGRRKIAVSQFPPKVQKADSYVLQRPSKWC